MIKYIYNEFVDSQKNKDNEIDEVDESILLSIDFKGDSIPALTSLLRLIHKGHPKIHPNTLSIDTEKKQLIATDTMQLAIMSTPNLKLFDKSLDYVNLDGIDIRRGVKNVVKIEVIEEDEHKFGILTLKNGNKIEVDIIELTEKQRISFDRVLDTKKVTPKHLPNIGKIKILKKLNPPLVLKFTGVKDTTQWKNYSYRKLTGVRNKKNQFVEMTFKDGKIKVYQTIGFTGMESTIVMANDILREGFFNEKRAKTNPELKPALFKRGKYDKKLLAFLDEMGKDETRLLGDIGTCPKEINQTVYLNFEFIENALDIGTDFTVLTHDDKDFKNIPIFLYSKFKTTVIMPKAQ